MVGVGGVVQTEEAEERKEGVFTASIYTGSGILKLLRYVAHSY